ncbi:hypothetical protein BpHYR1_016107 [Brachionus plicatilis]|uniref:Uncharacterized protein n=1 Tax=Brachionus plicatilis TaxID=10195 RepID=A0A3M7QRT1_BRAPC|nr:hypothetical protein BpHYR1_016107 [Brachionus plicatilis]
MLINIIAFVTIVNQDLNHEILKSYKIIYRFIFKLSIELKRTQSMYGSDLFKEFKETSKLTIQILT